MRGWKRLLLAAGTAGLVFGSLGCAAQMPDGRFPFAASANTTTASVTPYAPAGQLEWSGESGSSGHPLMEAEAIRAAAANFANCLERLWPLAARRGVSRATFDTYTAGLTPDLKIMDFMDAQPEFTKAIWDYIDTLVNENRIKRGREILVQHRSIFEVVERVYGVDRYVIAAIWGIESNYGTAIGERSVLRSTATLACVGRRQNYFRDEFLATLEILHRRDVNPDRLKGSWAGAFGPTQFMPTAFKRYAVDFDGDGRRDVVDSVGDLVASTANNLKLDGWIAGQTWGYEVMVPKGFDYMLSDSARTMAIGEWQRLGVVRANGKVFPRVGDRAYLLAPAGARGPAFLMLNNFRAILKYNPAEAYALAIGHLADRLRGDGPMVQPWPREERVLANSERYELQQLLIGRGFDIGGKPNGRINANTRKAIKRFQASAGLIADGFATADILDRLRAAGIARR